MTIVTNITQLNAAIVSAAGVTSGTVTITLGSDISFGNAVLRVINLHAGVTLVIEGGDHVLSGNGTQRGFFVYAGTVEIKDLSITNMVARGGDGGESDVGGGGGGGAGLGGGLFVGANVADNPGNVTLTNVNFAQNTAEGGQGSIIAQFASAPGGGGGLGGNGGAVDILLGGSGGGGIGADGGTAIDHDGGSGETGLVSGAAGGASGGAGGGGGPGAGGANGGGGGGGGAADNFFGPWHVLGGQPNPLGPGGGGGGGVGGAAGSLFAGGDGGYGGGGGGGGGDGGFGGGGGAGSGAGGFGGGGGAGTSTNGAAGFGGGGLATDWGYGGGGLGAGGAVFVQEGASLSFAGSTLMLFNLAKGGGTRIPEAMLLPGEPALIDVPKGQAFGSGIYLQGNNTLTFRPDGLALGQQVNQGQVISDVIGDDMGSAAAAGYGGAVGYTMGQTGIVVDGTGELVLFGNNTYSGATTVAQGTLYVGGSIARSAVTVQNGGTLSGIGTTGAVTVQSGGVFDPGASDMHTGSLSFSSGASFALQLGGTTAGNFDQVVVNGTVALGGATLDLSLLAGYTPAVGNSFRIIDNDGTADAVSGAFAGHAEGSTFNSGGASYLISYHGGDGNDVVLTAVAPNDPPVAVLDNGSITEDTAPNRVTGNVLGNDSDPDGNTLSVANAATVVLAHGSLEIHADGSYTYTLDNSNPAVDALNTGQSLVDRFTYTVSDGHGGTSSATLDITIHGRTDNEPPVVAGAVTLAAIAEDSGARLITQAQLLGNVTDTDGPSLTATDLVIATGSGTLLDNHDGTWSYTPALNDDTSVSFSWQVTDSFTSVADSATLDITPVNDAPVVTGAVTLAAIAEDSGARLITQAQLLDNVTDPDGPPSTAAGLTIVTGLGTLVDHSDGTWSYTPASDDDASVTFSYQVTDGVAASVASSATLDITAVNDAPVVTGAVTLLAIAEDSGPRLITQAQLLGNVTDIDSLLLTASTLTIATGSGALVDNHDGTWSYTPALNDDSSVSFSYQVTDGTTSLADSATLDITPVHDAPVVTGAVTLAAIAEDSGARLITQAQLLDNVTDVDGPSLTATAFAIATGSGSLIDNHNGTWSYTAAHNDDTAASFSWLVSDGTTSVADSGTLDITPVNDAPVNSLPASRFIVPNADVAVTGLAVGDVDSSLLTTTLHVEHGILNVGAVGGAAVAGSGSSTVTLTGSAAQIDAVFGAANNVLYHSVFNFSGIEHLTMTSNDGSLSDTDVLDLSVFEQVQAQSFGGIVRPTLTLDATGHIILDQPAAEFAATYGMKALYLGMPESTPYPPVAAHDFHLV